MAWTENVEIKKRPSRRASLQYAEELVEPKRWSKTKGGRAVESGERMFNAHGDMNAYDKVDAVRQQEKFAGLREKYPAKQARLSPEKESQIMEHVFAGNNPERRLKFGQQMVPLILDRLDYEGFIRQVFLTHSVAQGEIISYEKDINVAALVIADDGKTIESRIKGHRLFPPEFNITANPLVSVAEVATRQYDVVDRAHDKAAFEVMKQEDRNGLRLLYEASTIENSSSTITGTLDKSPLETIVNQVERHRLIVDKVLINRAELGDFRINIQSTTYDPLTSREVLLTGIFGQIWGYNIFVSSGLGDAEIVVPPGMVFAVAAPRFIGAMGIRVELTAFPGDQFTVQDPSYGWLFFERIAQLVVISRAVAMRRACLRQRAAMLRSMLRSPASRV